MTVVREKESSINEVFVEVLVEVVVLVVVEGEIVEVFKVERRLMTGSVRTSVLYCLRASKTP